MNWRQADKLRIVREFIEWLPNETGLITFYGPDYGTADLDALLEQYATEMLIECDSAIGHGPGHQSISECTVFGTHTEHRNEYAEWDEAEIGTQTWTRQRDGKVFRLAFTDYVW